VRLFCHISEFGPLGMQNVPVLAFLGDRLTLWAPSASFIRAASSMGDSMLSPDDVLDLVRRRHIQIMGRERWIYDSKFRDDYPAARYRFAAWDSSFDREIALMAAQDADLAVADRRVVVAPDEDGLTWAETTMHSDDPDHAQAREIARGLMSTNLTLGLREKLAKASTDEERLRVMLRDIRNHSKAFRDARSDQVVVLAQDAASYAAIVAGEADAAPSALAELERLPELVHFLSTLARPRTAEELTKLLSDSSREEFRREARSLLQANQPIDVEVLAQVTAGSRAASWRETLVGSNLLDAASRLGASGGGLLISLATLQFQPLALIGLVMQAAQTIGPLAQKIGLARAPDYRGPRFPFVLGFGTEDPTYREISRMVEELKQLDQATLPFAE